jgi:hypothetical protein
VAFVNESREDIMLAIFDLDIKTKWDDSFEFGRYTHVDLPFDSSASYFRFKKVMVVSPRDMCIIGKSHRINENETYLIAKTYVNETIPEVKGVVRADSLISGWRIKQIENEIPGVKKARCKIWFYSESDFKISMFLQKQVGPKTGHMALHFSQYIEKNPWKKL